jgi:hypothetical protein
VISGNAGGVGVWGLNATNNFIQGNFIGTDATGLLPLGNNGPGVWLSRGANHNSMSSGGKDSSSSAGGGALGGLPVD